jgi:hypothetical protein
MACTVSLDCRPLSRQTCGAYLDDLRDPWRGTATFSSRFISVNNTLISAAISSHNFFGFPLFCRPRCRSFTAANDLPNDLPLFQSVN